jgi:hypothetical protein
MTTPRDAVQFTRESADRIAGAVRTLELTPAGGAPLNFEKPAEQVKKQIRFGVIQGTWPLGEEKTVYVPDGTSYREVVSFNAIASVRSSDFVEERKVAIARDGTAWSYVTHNKAGCNYSLPAREITEDGIDLGSSDASIQPGGGCQVLANVAGCMKWLSMSPVTVITNARIDETSIVFECENVWVFKDVAPADEITLDGTECH